MDQDARARITERYAQSKRQRLDDLLARLRLVRGELRDIEGRVTRLEEDVSAARRALG